MTRLLVFGRLEMLVQSIPAAGTEGERKEKEGGKDEKKRRRRRKRRGKERGREEG